MSIESGEVNKELIIVPSRRREDRGAIATYAEAVTINTGDRTKWTPNRLPAHGDPLWNWKKVNFIKVFIYR